MKFTTHKCVLNVMTVPNPTQYTNSGKSEVKTIGPKLLRHRISHVCVPILPRIIPYKPAIVPQAQLIAVLISSGFSLNRKLWNVW